MKAMLATRGPIPSGPGWRYEVKWDGMRVLAQLDGRGGLRLASRNGNDVTDTLPELASLASLGRSAILDGEAVAFDSDGMPSFDRLTNRMGVVRRDRAAVLATEYPVTYLVFDLLELDGESLVTRPFEDRRSLLSGLDLPRGPYLVSDTFDDPQALLQATAERGLEGVIAKRLAAPYQPGVRSRDWVKHSHRMTSDAVVVGWRPGPGQSVASLALASVLDDGSLTYRGTAGSGITQAMAGAMVSLLVPATAAPQAAGLLADAERLVAAGFDWVRPGLVVEIAHLGYSGSGRFRQPVVVRVRPDLAGADSDAEPAPAAQTGDPVTVEVAGRTLRINHLDKVLYPRAGTTKAQVIEYYAQVAPHLLELAAGRPITRRRWPDGVAAPSFYEKNLPQWAPDWIRRVVMPTSKDPITWPVLGADDQAGLVWLAAHSALELHTPQWRVSEDGAVVPPDRLVIDLDPGPGVGLAQCGLVALLVRAELMADGLTPHAVLSGSKGLHLYAPLPDAERSADEITQYVRGVAQRCGTQAPGLVVVTMAKQARVGRVFFDWSQNRAAKTTLAPWSLRGTTTPQVALPITWDEIESGQLRQIQISEALARLAAGEVPLPW